MQETSYCDPKWGCAIKGKHSQHGDGEWIYHRPVMRYYDIPQPEERFLQSERCPACGITPFARAVASVCAALHTRKSGDDAPFALAQRQSMQPQG